MGYTEVNVKVDYVVRSDADAKHGGDLVQVEQYVSHLRASGLEERVLPFHPKLDLRPSAIVHIVNVDRPYDFLSAVQQAGSRPVVVSTIHHRLSAVRAMRNAETGQGLRTVAGRLPENVRELLAFSSRTWKTTGDPAVSFGSALRAVPLASRTWRRVGRALDNVDQVCLLAQGEGRDLTLDTGWHAENFVVIPNGVPRLASSAPTWAGREPVVLVVGRVEPRKRQLEIALEAAKVGARVCFVGAGSPTTSRYTKDFQALVDRSSTLEWAGAVEHEEVMARMRKCRALLNMSWVEVQSLVDIEAARAGMYVVANSNGNSEEWLGSAVTIVAPSEVASAVAAAVRLAFAAEGPPPVNYDFSWHDAASALAEVYHELR